MDSLVTFSASDLTDTNTAPEDYLVNGEPLDFIDFLAIAQHTKTDFLPITWDAYKELVGRGGSARISQSLINIKASFAFKRFSGDGNEQAGQFFKTLASEVLVLQSPAIRSHPNIVSLQGICWEFDLTSGTVSPVLVFPKAEHGDMRTYLSQEEGRAVPFGDRVTWCVQIAQAIDALHKNSMILNKLLKPRRADRLGRHHPWRH